MTDREKARIKECWDKIINDCCDGNKSAFARLLKMTPQSFQQYYNGERKPGWDILKRIAALGYSLNWLLIGIKPFKLSDLNSVEVSTIDVNKVSESEDTDYFSAVDWGDLSSAEAHLLEEVKQFSAFLESRETLRPQVKRLLIELLIQSIDRAIEPPRRDPDDN